MKGTNEERETNEKAENETEADKQEGGRDIAVALSVQCVTKAIGLVRKVAMDRLGTDNARRCYP
jgi:hypothetical protein